MDSLIEASNAESLGCNRSSASLGCNRSSASAAAAFDAASSKVGRKTAAILSLDGGGSRGVMELVVLDVIFRMLTVIVKNPKKMPR